MLHVTNNIKTNFNYLYKRIRIPIKYIYKNNLRAERLTEYIMSIIGVHLAKSNPVNGKVLIIFDEDTVNEIYIEKQICIYIKKANLKHNSDAIKISNMNEEISSSIAVKDVDSNISNNKQLYNSSNIASGTLWHSTNKNEIEAMLNTNIHYGLTSKVAKEKIKELGLNVLSQKKRDSIFSKFLESLNGFSSKLLLGVGTISLFLGQIPDAISIFGIVLIETVLGTAQQYKAEKSIYSLKDMIVHKANVLRNGHKICIDAKNLVVGDIILVEAGDKIPADARIIECYDLKTTEASLTGESASVMKSSDLCSKYAEIGSRHNMLFMGSNVICGKGKAIIVATGMNSEIGKIATMLQNIKIQSTPLEIRMKNFTNKLTKICLISCGVIGFVSFLIGKSITEILAMSVSFSIGALPESLPVIVTIATALGVQRLSKNNVIVRNLSALELLGSTNVICCDKTGTLTMNEMTIKRIYTDKCIYKVTGSGYNPEGNISLIEGEPTKELSLKKLLTAGVLCNNAFIVKENNKWIVNGDPTEGALIVAARKLKLNEAVIKNFNPRIKEIPFDSSKKFMTVITENSDDKIAFCKGALDCILEKCRTIYEDGTERLLTSTDKKNLMSVCNEMGENALRVLALSYKKISSTDSKNINSNFVFLGMVGMEDPPKKGVKNCIQKCHKAGIKVVMITGDYKNTAAAIGRELGLLTNGSIISGNELDNMTNDELNSKIEKVQIFARTSPAQKYRIVKAFKRCGYVVTMAGDGVNDAPAIKEANIGIAMGNNGSDVAKDAASITLVDDNFCTIVKAIEEGRTVNSNIKHSMRYLLSGNLGEIIAIALSSITSGVLPLISVQILWTNVISESILGSALAAEPSSDYVMDSAPVKTSEPLISKELQRQIIVKGTKIGLTTFGIFEGSLLFGVSLNKARTLAFSNLICSQFLNLYVCRGNKKIRNKYMDISTTASMAMLLGIIYIPFMSSYFGTEALTLLDWGGVGGMLLLGRK